MRLSNGEIVRVHNVAIALNTLAGEAWRERQALLMHFPPSTTRDRATLTLESIAQQMRDQETELRALVRDASMRAASS